MSHQSTATHKLKVKAVDAVLQSAKPNISGLDGFVSMGPPSNGFCWVNFAGEDAAKKAQAAINGPSFFSSQLNAMEPQALPVQPPRGPVQTFRPAVPGPALPAHAVPTPAVHPSPAAGGGHSSVADVTISVSNLKFPTSTVPAELSDKIVQPVPGPHQVKVQGFADHHKPQDLEAALKDLYERRASKKLAGFKQTSSCLGNPPKMYCWFTFNSFDQLQDCKMQCENAQLLSAGSLQWKEIRKFEPPPSRSAEVSPSTSPVSSRSPSPVPASFRLPARSGGARLRLGPDGLPEEHLTNLALMKNCMVRFLPEELKSSLPDIKVIASKKQAELIFDQNFGLAQEIYESFIGMPVFTAMTDGTNIKIDLLPLSSDDVLRSSSEEVRAAAVESEAQLQSHESRQAQGAVLPNPSAPVVSLAGVETIFRIQISGSGKPAKTVTIRLIDADITQWQGDVIVNAANESLLGGGGVDGAIHSAAGPGLLAACRRVVPDKSNGHRCKVGEAKLTQGPFDGSRLGASHVIHTVGPRGSAQNRAVLLSSAYTSALDLVIQNSYSSVAFPSISTGIFQYPKDEAAATAAKAITSFLQKHQDIQYLSKIDLCILDPSNVLLWSQALKSVLSGPVVPPPPVDEALKKHMGVLLYRMRKGSASDQVCMEVLLGHVGNQLVPISAQPLEKDDGGTGENRAQMLALEALRNGTGDLMSSQGLAHVGATISGQPPLVCGSHHLWFVHSVDNNSLAQDAAQISSSYALLRKRSDRVVSVAALQWISIETFTKQDSAAFPKIQPQLLRNTQPHAKQLSGIHAVLKNPALTAKLQELFQIGSQRIAAEESSQKDTLLKKLEADIAAAGAELPVLAQHVEQLSIESDPVPPVESLPECHDIVTLAEPPTGVKLTSGSKQPVRIRKVNIPEREQRFDAYLASRASGFRSSARSFHGTPTLAAAASIARAGPDLSRAGKNIGKAYGAGFYTDTDPAYPEGVAGSGSVLVCTVAPGKSCSQGNSSTTAATLSMQGFDSVAPRGWHVLFHPDAVRVDYIVDYSFQGDEAAEKRLAQEKAHELAKQQRETQEMSRKAKLASKQARQKMVQTFVARCEELVSFVNAQLIGQYPGHLTDFFRNRRSVPTKAASPWSSA
jgi:O-acetyl-ADP-ribose deacetylase (regulator of RNase III)